MLYRFGPYDLDDARFELRCAGVPVPLEPQVFEVLALLVANAGRVVRRDMLVEVVWHGRFVSDAAISSRIHSARQALGDSGRAQTYIRTITGRGFSFVGEVATGGSPSSVPPSCNAAEQTVGFARAADGARVAYAVSGEGPPLVKAAHWLTHVEHDWHSPVWAPLLTRLSARHRLVRYDTRGTGLSADQGAAPSFSGFVEDLGAVVDRLALPRFTLFGMSQGAAVSLAYAAAHPDRVERLILYGAYGTGRDRRRCQADRQDAEALRTLMRHGWGRPNSAFVRAFSALYMPAASRAQLDWFTDLQRRAATPEMAIRLREACDALDVHALVAQVHCPVLVLHARGDAVVPADEGMALAAALPDATFQTLDSDNHILLPDEPAWEALCTAVERFLGDAGGPVAGG